jgi:bifunctional enzyme CysN/CysC
MEMARRYGEVARLLADTGLIVVSTTNPFGMAYEDAAQAIKTLVHPTPVISIHMSKLAEAAPPNADIAFSGPADFDAATKRILEELKRRGVLAQAIGAKPTFQYSI